jgi:hypothetical protein
MCAPRPLYLASVGRSNEVRIMRSLVPFKRNISYYDMFLIAYHMKANTSLEVLPEHIRLGNKWFPSSHPRMSALGNWIFIEEAIAEGRVTVSFRAAGP